MIKKRLRHICLAFLLAGLSSCGAYAGRSIKKAVVGQNSVSDDALAEVTENISLITTVYDRFVFAMDSQGDVQPETYFTANALRKLQGDYEFDCDEQPCYAFYALRSEMQDSNPETDGASRIYNIEPVGDGWYVVSYSDMGWPAKTRIKIADGKIDDYERIIAY